MKGFGKLTVIFGGQWGSEGKGEVAAYISRDEDVDIGVRIGGPNAGHTSYDEVGRKVVVQSLPTPSAIVGADAVIGAEGAIIPELLREELVAYANRNGQVLHKLTIDNCVAIIGPEHMSAEQGLMGAIGSTGEGVGAATAEKVMRKPGLIARDHAKELRNWLGMYVDRLDIRATVEDLNAKLRTGNHLLLEGTQGLRLGLHTSGYYPYCTSRECSPAALLAGTGINPKLAGEYEVIMVVRTYPIRVGGNSGPLPNEITWEWLQERMAEHGIQLAPERTTVTKKVRRIARIDWRETHKAIEQTGPDALAVTFLDYEFPEHAGMVWGGGRCRFEDLPEEVKSYLSQFLVSGVPVKYVSTGPNRTTKLLY